MAQLPITEQKNKYAVAYLRVSTSLQDCANQRLAIEQFAKDNGFKISSIFQDEATSGRTDPMNRQGFRAMMEFVKANQTHKTHKTHNTHTDAILVYSISRIGRDMLTTLETIRNAEKIAPIIPIAPSEKMLQSLDPTFRAFMMAVFGFMADLERKMIGERTRTAMARLKAEGRHLGREKKQLDKELVLTLMVSGVPRYKIAKTLDCSKVTLYANLHRWNIPVKVHLSGVPAPSS